MSEQHDGYTADELGQYVDALSKNVIAYSQRHPMQKAIDAIDKYCDGHHSALDGCECAILIALIRGREVMVELSLAEYREQLLIQRIAGAELERERIIKLLTDKASNTWAGVIYLNQAVVLIRGEK